MIIFILAQFFSVMKFVFYLLSNWQKDKRKILLFLIMSNVVGIMQYILLGAYTACLSILVSLIRNTLFRKYKNKSLLLVILGMYCACCIITYDGWLSITLTLVSCIRTMLTYGDNAQHIRYGAVGAGIFWFIYDTAYKAYVAVILDAITLISHILAVIHYKRSKKVEEKRW